MNTTSTVRPTSRPSVVERVRPWWLWIVTALAFPPAGYIANRVAGPVDGVAAALLAGVIAGALLGTGQWAVLRRRGGSPVWIAATATGFGVGLAAGAALVDYETSLAALVVMGAVCGIAVGLVQAVSFAPLRRHVAVWTVATGGLWALGWAVTTSAGIKVEDQWPLFGISGALVAAFLQSVLVNRLVPANESNRAVVTVGDELHVVFGSGPAGRAVATELTHQGPATRLVNRTGRQVLDGVETLGGDVTDPHFAHAATAGASTVYFCLNAVHYDRWPQEFPPLQYAVLDAASAAGARLVVLENLYMYGPTGGAPMTESTPRNPTGTKGAVRARMSDELIDAHRAGQVEVVIGRAADFVGPGVTASAMGEFVFGAALAGKKARTMGRPGHPALVQLRTRHRPQPRLTREPNRGLRMGLAPPQPAHPNNTRSDHRRVRRAR